MGRWLVFQAYHDGEILDYRTELIGGHTVRQVWDGQNLSWFEDADLPTQFYEKLYDAAWSGYKAKKVDWAEIESSRPSVYAVDIWDEAKFLDQVSLLVTRVVGLREHAHGDDSYFDYYPDLWFILDQISDSLENESFTNFVKEGKQVVYGHGFYHDEDMIGHKQALDNSPTGISGGVE